MTISRIEFPTARLNDICRRWQVRELSVFGSAVRNELRADSDIDLLVTFANDAPWSLWDLFDLREELGSLFGRSVDLVEERSLTNPFRRRSILRDKQVIYAAEG
jgi:predicted nucleotidyltransferase